MQLVAACAVGAWLWWGKHERGETSLPQGAAPAIAATVPKEIRATGRLVIGVNVPYAPNEFKNSDGQIVGFDVDLMNAIAKTLGLAPDYREIAFESIVPSVQTGQFNVGMSSVTDTAERQADRPRRRVRAPGRRGDSFDPGNERAPSQE